MIPGHEFRYLYFCLIGVSGCLNDLAPERRHLIDEKGRRRNLGKLDCEVAEIRRMVGEGLPTLAAAGLGEEAHRWFLEMFDELQRAKDIAWWFSEPKYDSRQPPKKEDELASAARAIDARAASTNDVMLLVRGFHGKAEVRQRKRRRATPRTPTPLTGAQVEAVQLVGVHKGNISAAAKAAGKSRTAMQKLYDKAMKKLGKSASVLKPKTKTLPHDNRGQVNIAADEEE